MTQMVQIPGRETDLPQRGAPTDDGGRSNLPLLTRFEITAARWLGRPVVAGLVCGLVLCVFAVAGLWPFGPTKNQVSWLESRPGLRFGETGVALTPGILVGEANGACTIETWVVPAEAAGTRTILSFYGPEGGQGIALQRYESTFRIDRETGKRRRVMYFPARDLLDQKPVFLTLVHGARESVVYVEGAEVWRSDTLRATAGDCAGGLGVGHPAKGRTSWQGEIWGLAIYGHEFSPEEVRANHQAWLRSGAPREEAAGLAKVLYFFDEGSGDRVRDHGSAGLDLTIPADYRDIRPNWFQLPPELEFWTPGTLEDVVVNVAGFVPFGFALCALLRARLQSLWAGLGALAGGLAVSLTIEFLQVFLPTRDSDLTDILTNTLGAGLGALLLVFWRLRLLRMPAAPDEP